MEDYEKKYKDALERAKNIYGASESKDILSTLTTIFPELAGSEDERIRKALIRFHKSTIDIDGIKGDRIVAWLEKQGESYTKKDIDDAYLKGICDAKHELEKQGEQKPTSNTRYKVSAGGSLNVNGKPFDYEHATITQKDFAPINVTDEGIVEAIKNTSVLDMIEQKQEWSEEDEKIANDLIKGCLSSVSPYQLTHTCQEIADWLKSIKDRIIVKAKGGKR